MLTLHRCLLPFLCLKCVCLPRLSLSRWTTENRERTVVDGGETADEFHAPACELFCMAKTGFFLSFWQCTDTYICKCVYVPIFLWNVRYKCRLLNRWWQHVCMKTWNHAHILHCCRRSKHSCIRFLRTWSLRSNLFLSHLLFWHMGTLWAPEPPSRPGLLYSARTSEARPVGLPVRIKRPPSSHRVIILILTHTALSQSLIAGPGKLISRATTINQLYGSSGEFFNGCQLHSPRLLHELGLWFWLIWGSAPRRSSPNPGTSLGLRAGSWILVTNVALMYEAGGGGGRRRE